MKKFLFSVCAVLAIWGCGDDDRGLPCLSLSNCDICNKQIFNPSKEFCFGDTIYSKCGGREYDPLAYQYCYNDTVKTYDTISYGGQTYKTVVIGSQTWFAENLNAGTSACYNNEPSNCAAYGKLYDWSTAMGFQSICNSNFCSSQIQSPHKGICPEGWHIPSNADWDELYRYVDGTNGTSSPYNSPTAGKYLKAMSGWKYCGPSDSGNTSLCEGAYGFSALPGGYGHLDGRLGLLEYSGYWWSASEYNQVCNNNNNCAYHRTMKYLSDSASWDYDSKLFLLSVRCIKN